MKYLMTYLAQIIPAPPIPKDPLSAGSLSRAFTIFFGVTGAIAVISVIYGGIRYSLSQGNPQELSKSKDIILNSMIGLGVILTAAGIVSLLTKYL